MKRSTSQDYTKTNKHDYAPIIVKFLKEHFKLDASRLKQNILELPSGVILHTKESSSKSKWYGLDKKIFDEFMSLAPNTFLILSLDSPENTFVIPRDKILDIFEERALQQRPRRTMMRWMIRIKNIDGRYILTIDHSKKSPLHSTLS